MKCPVTHFVMLSLLSALKFMSNTVVDAPIIGVTLGGVSGPGVDPSCLGIARINDETGAVIL